MEKSKYCCRIFPIILIVISFFIALGIWYFDEGIHSFSFLTNKNEIFNFLGTVLFIAIIPIGIFYWPNDKEKYQSRAKALSLLGFLPVTCKAMVTMHTMNLAHREKLRTLPVGHMPAESLNMP